jgi:hypothetical protein
MRDLTINPTSMALKKADVKHHIAEAKLKQVFDFAEGANFDPTPHSGMMPAEACI